MATTWDPANKNANITLSGGNLVATSGTLTGFFVPVFSTGSITTAQKIYWEITVTTIGATAQKFGVGVGNALSSTGDNFFIGVDTTGIAIYDNGAVFYNLTQVATYGSFGAGNVVNVAVDFSAGLIWWATNGGIWNANALANAATGTGGQTIGVSGNLLPGVTLEYDGTTQDVATADFGATTFAYPALFAALQVAGYTSFDSSGDVLMSQAVM